MYNDIWSQVVMYLGTYGMRQFAGNLADALHTLASDVPDDQRSEYADLVNALRRIVERSERRNLNSKESIR